MTELKHGTQKDRDTVFEFAVPANVPVDQVMFQVGQGTKNFHRQVILHVKEVLDNRQVSEAHRSSSVDSNEDIFRLQGEQDGVSLHEERLSVTAPVVGFSKNTVWTITVKNGDDSPLPVESVMLAMAERKLCYEAAPGASYSLFYGDTELHRPEYDYSRFFAPKSNASVSLLEAEQQNALHIPRADNRPFTERHRALLWVALLVVLVVLGFITFHTATRTEGKES